MSDVRTFNSIKNIVTTIVPYLLIGILGFLKTAVFIRNYSTAIISINQLFLQIFSYFILLEAGLGAFIISKYYKYLSEENYENLNEIYSSSIIAFKKIANLIIGIGLVFSFFLILFTKAEINHFYLQICFFVFIVKNVIDYYFMAPRLIIQADQRMYEINTLIYTTKLLENLLEIYLFIINVNYLVVLIPGIFIRIIVNKMINKKIARKYPWLRNLKVNKKEHLKGISHTFSMKITGIFYGSTDIVLLSAFVSPLSVVIYSSYNYVIKYVTDILFMVGAAIVPSIANLKSESEEKQYEVFRELNILFLYIAAVISIVFSIIITPFIEIWVGKVYLIKQEILYLFLLLMFNDISRRSLYSVVYAKALFKEMKNIMFLEAGSNLLFSIIFVQYWGIAGVLLGSLFSIVISTFWYVPILIIRKMYNGDLKKYYLTYLKVTFFTVSSIISLRNYTINNDLLIDWFIQSVIISGVVAMIVFIVLLIADKDFQHLWERVKYTIVHHLKRN